jgi:hypothetical protein
LEPYRREGLINGPARALSIAGGTNIPDRLRADAAPAGKERIIMNAVDTCDLINRLLGWSRAETLAPQQRSAMRDAWELLPSSEPTVRVTTDWTRPAPGEFGHHPDFYVKAASDETAGWFVQCGRTGAIQFHRHLDVAMRWAILVRRHFDQLERGN